MAEEESPEQEDIELRHSYSDEYRLFPATGADGGIQPDGDFKMDFFYDHDYRTTSESYDPDQGFLTGVTIEGHMRREHLVGVSMDVDKAQQVGIWLLDKTTNDDINRTDIVEAIRNAAGGEEPI